MKNSVTIFLKTILFILVLIYTSTGVFSQTDNPCGAPSLTINSSCTFGTGNLSSTATATGGVPAPTCGSYSGGDVWYTVTAPVNGTITINTNTAGGSTDMAMALYSATACNGVFTQVICDDDSSPNGAMPMFSASGLVPGAVYYVRLWDYGGGSSGNFQICAYSPNSSCLGGSNNSCAIADPFCTGISYNYCNTTGVANMGAFQCLSTTPNPMWMYLNIATGGNIDIYIEQFDWLGNGIDVDFALYGPYGSQAASCPITSATSATDCSYSPAPTETANIVGAVAGEWYVLLITNYADDAGYIQFSQTGGSASTNCNIVLPVELVSLNAVCENNVSLIEWTTATEINNDYFIVERSDDGINYIKMDTINGNGNTNQIINYSWIDRKIKPERDYYYRLRQVDYDGKYYLHGPVHSKCDGNLSGFYLYPNPTEESFNLNFNGETEEDFVMEIYDITGKTVFSKKHTTSEGENSFKMNISDFAKGFYEISVKSDTQQKTFKLIKE